MWIAARRCVAAPAAAGRRPGSALRPAALRPATRAGDVVGPGEQLAQLSSREATVRDSRDRPSSDALTSAGLSLNSVESVSSDFASWPVSICSVVVVRSEKASTTSYDDVVRDSGISRRAAQLARAGRREREVLLAQQGLQLDRGGRVACRAGCSPRTVNVTITWAFSRSTPVTLPTVTPAIRTGSPVLQPAGLGERGVVRVAAADQRQLLHVEAPAARAPPGRQADGADRPGSRSRNGSPPSAHEHLAASTEPMPSATGTETSLVAVGTTTVPSKWHR